VWAISLLPGRDDPADANVVTGFRAGGDRVGQAFQVAGAGYRASRLGHAGADDEALEGGEVHAGHSGTAEEVARAVLFLADPASSYIIGTNIKVSGGYLI
jgi:NAD(P)-dependent dehydrogenase (short-subunit alcohol dehydrogenase family)